MKKGKAWAQSMLGDRYKGGEGVKKDLKRAVVLFNLALRKKWLHENMKS